MSIIVTAGGGVAKGKSEDTHCTDSQSSVGGGSKFGSGYG